MPSFKRIRRTEGDYEPVKGEFQVKVINVKSRSAKNWVVARASIKGKLSELGTIGLVGVDIPGDEILPGNTYRIGGTVSRHEQYGLQLKFASYVLASPGGKIGTIKYLQEAKGIGPVAAARMWDLYKDEAVDYVRDSSRHSMITKQCNVDLDVLEQAKSTFDLQEACQGTRIELIEMLDKSGVPQSVITELINHHGVRAAEWLGQNYFRLMQYSGAGFTRADKLYLRNGGDPSRIRRHAYAAENAIFNDADENHVWHAREDIVESMNKKLKNARIDVAIRFGVKVGFLAVKVICGVEYVASARVARAEEYVAKDLARRIALKQPAWGNELEAGDLTEHQAEQGNKALSSNAGVLWGGGGVGKTYTLCEIIRKLPRRDRLAVCCPTGKAAERARESLVAAGITDVKPRTIHSTLGAFMEKGKFQFKYGNVGDQVPLKVDYIICDEFSMCDIELFANLLRALPAMAHILFIGDKGQLAPVGAGNPFRDLIDSPRVPTGELTEIHRNAGAIVRFSHAIRLGTELVTHDAIDEDSGENLRLVTCYNESQQFDAIKSAIIESNEAGYHPINDIMTITPRNKGGEVTRTALNRQLQAFINLANETGRVGKNPFLPEDPCICLRNDDYPTAYARPIGDVGGSYPDEFYSSVYQKGPPKYLVNGAQGRIVSISTNWSVARLPDGALVKITHSENGEPNNWDLAYCLTAHKSQGSEAPVVIVVIDDSWGGRMVSSAEWLYTAVTRASKRAYIVGLRDAMEKMARDRRVNNRRTDLIELLGRNMDRIGDRPKL